MAFKEPANQYEARSNEIAEAINENFISREGETEFTLALTAADAVRLATLAAAYETRTLAMIQYRAQCMAQGINSSELDRAIHKRLGL